MAQLSVIFGSLLVMIGAVGYVLTDMVSVTALIPAFFGLAIILLGVMAYTPARRKLAMHLAMGVAVLGVLGSASGLIGLARSLGGPPAGAADISRSLMAIALACYLGLGIKSFVAARRARD